MHIERNTCYTIDIVEARQLTDNEQHAHRIVERDERLVSANANAFVAYCKAIAASTRH